MRRIMAFIVPDEAKLLDKHPKDGVGVAFDTEMEKLKGDGIRVNNWAVVDDDDEHSYARYLCYLFDWTMDHVEDFDKLESPMTYEEWRGWCS